MDIEYAKWLNEPTPENMGQVLKSVDPILISEVQRYSGPNNILHSKAKSLAVKAIKSYDPSKGTKLRSWITTQLKPLSRYSQQLQPVKTPEMVRRQAAEINTINERLKDRLGRTPTLDELADESGLSKTKIERVQSRVKPAMSESEFTSSLSDNNEDEMPAMQFPSQNDYAFEAVYQDLNPREKVITDWKIGAHGKDRLSNQEIAKRLGVTPAVISQITNRVVKKIQEVASYALQ